MPTPLVTTRPRMKRVRHRSEPERYGSGIELARGRGSDRRVLVKWDNGLQQFHDKGEILPEGTIMKITKRQLRRIIKEEKAKLTKEVYAPQSSIPDEIAKIDDAVDMMFQLGMTVEDIQEELRAMADMLPSMNLGPQLDIEPDER